MSPALYIQLFSVEVRKLLSYRLDFWANFLGYILVEVGCGYAVWKAIFAARGVESINGYTVSDMITYYVVASLVVHSIRGKSIHTISKEIYEGTLNRYLVYPVSFLVFKFVEQFAVCCIGALQGLLALIVYFCISDQWPISNFLQLFEILISGFLGIVIFYLMLCAIELWSFWVDNIWSMSVMFLKGFAMIFGGTLFPIAMFGDYAAIVKILPFYSMYGIVIETMTGKADLDLWIIGVCYQLLWIIVLGALTQILWKRGKLQYSGVGI